MLCDSGASGAFYNRINLIRSFVCCLRQIFWCLGRLYQLSAFVYHLAPGEQEHRFHQEAGKRPRGRNDRVWRYRSNEEPSSIIWKDTVLDVHSASGATLLHTIKSFINFKRKEKILPKLCTSTTHSSVRSVLSQNHSIESVEVVAA